MDTIVIVLVILIVILILYMIYYNTKVAQVLINLNVGNSPIVNSSIPNPPSARFSYITWIYVNSWSNNQKVVCYSSVGGSTPSNTPLFKLYLDTTTPTMKCDFKTSDSTNTVTISNNFPLQRWVYVIVSVDGQVVDCYLDGKLVKSQQLTSLPDVSGKYDINYGRFDAFLTMFSRPATATDPQTAWSGYLNGNGFSANATGPTYGFNVAVTKDQKPIAEYSY